MKQLVEVIAKSLVENPDEVVVTEKNCQGNPYCCESGFFKKQQKSDCRYSAMKNETGAVDSMAPVFTLKGSKNGRFIKSRSYHNNAWCPW